jgi:hypothetical protein
MLGDCNTSVELCIFFCARYYSDQCGCRLAASERTLPLVSAAPVRRRGDLASTGRHQRAGYFIRTGLQRIK